MTSRCPERGPATRAGAGAWGVDSMDEARRRTVRSGEITLSVATYGVPAHPPVVLVHGYPDSKEVWSLVVERLADRFHVVVYDVRGHGGSTPPSTLRGGFRLERLTDDFLAVVDAVSPDRPVHLVGHDWGSVQGWEFATVARTRGRIASFTSISGPSLDHFGHWVRHRLRRPTPRRAAQVLGQGAKSWYVYALHTPVLPELAWRGVLGRRWPKLLARAERLPSDDYPTASLPQDAAHGAWLYRDNVRRRVRRPRPDPYAHVPVQLITPTGDPFLSPRVYDDLEHWAPGLLRRTLPAKHWVPRTRPDQLARWIADFAARHESAAGAGPESPAALDDRDAPGTAPIRSRDPGRPGDRVRPEHGVPSDPPARPPRPEPSERAAPTARPSPTARPGSTTRPSPTAGSTARPHAHALARALALAAGRDPYAERFDRSPTRTARWAGWTSWAGWSRWSITPASAWRGPHRLRGYPPGRVADAAPQAAPRNAAVAPVTPEALGARLLSRLAPGALRAIARTDPPL